MFRSGKKDFSNQTNVMRSAWQTCFTTSSRKAFRWVMRGLAGRRLIPAAEAAASLRGMVRHHYELVAESTERKNKFTAICDELFPEFTRLLRHPHLPTARALRERFPPEARPGGCHILATASSKGTNLQCLGCQTAGVATAGSANHRKQRTCSGTGVSGRAEAAHW
jgi:hypothetical protein